MNGHRSYLDLGRRTAPTSTVRQAIGRKWHRQWSNPPASGTLSRQAGDRRAPLGSGPTGEAGDAQ